MLYFSLFYIYLELLQTEIVSVRKDEIDNNDKPADFITLKALQLVSHFHWLFSTLCQTCPVETY